MALSRTLAFVALASAGALTLVALAARANSPSFGGDKDDPNMASNKVLLWNDLLRIPELDDTQRYFLMLTAAGESGYSPRAHNDSPGERAAAQKALDDDARIVELANDCGVPLSVLADGSSGMFGRLRPYYAWDAVEIFGRTAACPFANPSVINRHFQICSAIETARDLQGYTGWKVNAQTRTVGNLRLGFASPGFMGYLTKHADRLDKYRELAAKEKFPPGIVDAPIAVFPSNVAAIYQRLAGLA